MRSLRTAAALGALALALADAGLAAPAPETWGGNWSSGSGNSWSSLGWSGPQVGTSWIGAPVPQQPRPRGSSR